jgi:uncharacterized membrane-anchored protein YhcB (DUF1043 family)
MNTQEELNNFKQKFYAYQNLIKRYSEEGQNLVSNISDKANFFNKLTDDQRIQFINTDPDFQQFNKVVSDLQQTYVQFYSFMNAEQSLKPQDQVQNPQVQKPQEVQAPPDYYDED